MWRLNMSHLLPMRRCLQLGHDRQQLPTVPLQVQVCLKVDWKVAALVGSEVEECHDDDLPDNGVHSSCPKCRLRLEWQ